MESRGHNDNSFILITSITKYYTPVHIFCKTKVIKLLDVIILLIYSYLHKVTKSYSQTITFEFAIKNRNVGGNENDKI